MSKAVLRLEGIEKFYNRGEPGEVRVLQGAGLEIAAGEIVALVAPSGAGKSTLLHISGLLDTADAGTQHVGDREIASLSDNQRTRIRRQDIGFIYQFHHLLPEFTAAENILLPQLADGVDRSVASNRAHDLLDRVGLAHRAAHRPAQLSGGEQQRTAFCRAMANSPRLLLADEPTGNLDPATSDQVFAMLLAMVRETGLGALIATHNLELAKRMDRIVTLDEGVIVPHRA